MHRLSLACGSCGRSWAAARGDNVYERLTAESCPCPNCGAYTLGLHPLTGPTAFRARKRPLLRTNGSDRAASSSPATDLNWKVEIRRIAG